MEQELYQDEGLDVNEVQVVDNADIIALIEKKPMGVIALLQEECKLNGSDATFIQKLHQNLCRSDKFITPKLNRDRIFVLTHFAGMYYHSAVCYLS